MRPSICALLVSFALVANLSEAQQSKSQSAESGVPSSGGNETTIISLLQQSHYLEEPLPVNTRLSLLARQAPLVSQLRVDLGREWANELFALSFQTKGHSRSIAQGTAMRILASIDPDRALTLLHSMSMEETEANRSASLPMMQSVQRVFLLLATRDGASALPVLEQEAARLGAEGHYPYSALGFAAMRAASKDWGSDNLPAVEAVQLFFQRAFARYSQDAHGYFDDLEFGKMLQVVQSSLAREALQPAVRVLVKNLLATDIRKYQFQADVLTSDGKSAKVYNAIDSAILIFGELIDHIDPELAEELKSTRPELKTALVYAKDGRAMMISETPQNTQPSDPVAETWSDALRFSRINHEAAIAKAEQLPDDGNRASALLEVARVIAADHPERAANLIAETQRGDKTTDEEMQLNLISAQASVAAAQDKKVELHELLQRGFALADRIILDQQRTGGMHFVDGLLQLVQIGTQNDPDLTIAFVQSLSPSYLKAELLLEAAWALSGPMRLPLGSRPQQRVEKPDQ
jgi:hypothetical protein